MEQRYAIKFFWWMGKPAQQTYQEMKEVYQDNCLGWSMNLHWHNFFTKDRELAVLEPHSGRPALIMTEMNIDTVTAIIRDDRHILVRMLESMVHIRNHLYTEFSENICRCVSFAPHRCRTFSCKCKWSDV